MSVRWYECVDCLRRQEADKDAFANVATKPRCVECGGKLMIIGLAPVRPRKAEGEPA